MLKTLGGKDMHHNCVHILKRLVNNLVGSQYSLHGKKKKNVFKDLQCYKLVIETVRSRFPDSTEIDISKVIATWLTQCTLRCLREQ